MTGDELREKLVEAIARAMYDAWEGPIANQDFKRQTRQWEICQLIAPAALTAIERLLADPANGCKLTMREPTKNMSEFLCGARNDTAWREGFDAAPATPWEREGR